ncbi:hypothetical protein FEF34_23080 [Streptomyces marianii]|uniref:Uncharacterized protein n=1 Tax=Streptomyces marianii TaxID=1817406 RepID=A0A5R9E887_9ACTN|nr:hypothetical protein FEF34_23080 [Streptomyces marianii]
MTEAHTSGFTVVGNHLAQHRGLSCLAIGLAVHIQSLRALRPRLPRGGARPLRRLCGVAPRPIPHGGRPVPHQATFAPCKPCLTRH